ncbi:MAG: hypothetical protein M3247_04645 [Thermoproteota archaeon]|nr:hypothetical protein [Thermoproteota archaeon]
MSQNESVPVVVTPKVKRSRESEYEDGLRRTLEECKYIKGYLGATIQRPATGSTEYTIIFRFDTINNLRKFEESELRYRYLHELIDYLEADPIWKKIYWIRILVHSAKGHCGSAALSL